MDKYTIYCTEEQTRKALNLGAPIVTTPMLDILRHEVGKAGFVLDSSMYWFPTAEQMIGWLEEQGFIFYIYKDVLWNGEAEYGYKWYGSSYDVNSRETATLAVIDEALDYLIKNKK